MNGAVIWRGPSLLTGDPIFVVVTGIGRYASTNTKTGPMAQVWILREDIAPTEAVNTGGDDAICGNCRHRSGSNIGRSCYVIWWTAPMQVWKTCRDQPVTRLKFEDVVGRPLRISAYGDPAAVPTDLWTSLVLFGGKWTGYTHQWRTCDQTLRGMLMASVDSKAERAEAIAKGWRTFRVRREEDTLDGDIVCPASEEGGMRTTCAQCRLCQGTSTTAKNIAILPHGQRVKWLTAE